MTGPGLFQYRLKQEGGDCNLSFSKRCEWIGAKMKIKPLCNAPNYCFLRCLNIIYGKSLKK